MLGQNIGFENIREILTYRWWICGAVYSRLLRVDRVISIPLSLDIFFLVANDVSQDSDGLLHIVAFISAEQARHVPITRNIKSVESQNMGWE